MWHFTRKMVGWIPKTSLILSVKPDVLACFTTSSFKIKMESFYYLNSSAQNSLAPVKFSLSTEA